MPVDHHIAVTYSDSLKKDDKDKKKKFGQGKFSPGEYNSEPASGDFGIPIHECTPSHENEFIPLVVELCTKAIEDRGLEFVGIYRVPGNKAAVELLKKELNQVLHVNQCFLFSYMLKRLLFY